MTKQPVPDFVYDADDWEHTYAWDDRVELVDDLGERQGMNPGDIHTISTLYKGPTLFAACVPTVWDEDGQPDDYDLVWFPTIEAATLAVEKAVTRHRLGLKP